MSPTVTILQGDVREQLRTVPDASVHCVVTSPPYWGLRDYGLTPLVYGGDPVCEHSWNGVEHQAGGGQPAEKVRWQHTGEGPSGHPKVVTAFCSRCSGWQGSLGLEPTPELYVEHLVAVFREVRRVLRDDGTCWINLGDSYAASRSYQVPDSKHVDVGNRKGSTVPPGLKPKDLIGIPWRVAFALQADGWVLRQEIIWAKKNAMPESVQDRCTKSHEQMFMFAKARWVGPPPTCEHISDEDARWLALFLDTEGNVCIKRVEREDGRTQYGAQIAFANTSRRLLDTARRIVGRGTILERPGKNAPMFYYQLSNQEAGGLLSRLYPFLIVKPRQARLAIHVQAMLSPGGKTRPGRFRHPDLTRSLEAAWAAMKSLNHFGSPDISHVPEPAYGHWDSQPYYYDAEAVKEKAIDIGRENGRDGRSEDERARPPGSSARTLARLDWTGRGRNLRSVWHIATQPYPEAHFATFPEALVRPCILAGTSERGVCPTCGAPWARMVETPRPPADVFTKRHAPEDGLVYGGSIHEGEWKGHGQKLQDWRDEHPSKTIDWRPTCDHGGEPVPATVLDPFAGSGTTLLVAQSLGRSAVGIELNPEYAALAERRTAQSALV